MDDAADDAASLPTGPATGEEHPEDVHIAETGEGSQGPYRAATDEDREQISAVLQAYNMRFDALKSKVGRMKTAGCSCSTLRYVMPPAPQGMMLIVLSPACCVILPEHCCMLQAMACR